MPKVKVMRVSPERLLIAVVAALCSGCFHAEDETIDRQCGALAKSFFRLPPEQQLAEFSKRDLEHQYIAYICGTQVIHPPALGLAEPIAREGQAAVPFLKGKLLQAQGDLTIRDIIAVFAEMSRQGTYNVAADTELVQMLNDGAARMKDDGIKRVTTQMVNGITTSR